MLHTKTLDAAFEADEPNDDSGFGLVEIVVSMFLLALLAIALLPVLIQGLQLSATNATRAAATQLVQARVELARSKPAVCSTLTSDLAGVTTSVADARGIRFVTTTTLDACPSAANLPSTVKFVVSVSRVGAPAGDPALAAVTTLLYLGPATP